VSITSIKQTEIGTVLKILCKFFFFCQLKQLLLLTLYIVRNELVLTEKVSVSKVDWPRRNNVLKIKHLIVIKVINFNEM
jgi:hypothetical protein